MGKKPISETPLRHKGITSPDRRITSVAAEHASCHICHRCVPNHQILPKVYTVDFMVSIS